MFTNREIAIIFWLVVLFLYIITDKSRRVSLIDVLKILTSRIFLIIISSMLIYISGIIYVLYKVGYWEVKSILVCNFPGDISWPHGLRPRTFSIA